jgi:hypothetical protein
LGGRTVAQAWWSGLQVRLAHRQDRVHAQR